MVINDNGTATVDTEIEGNEGKITFELHNADGSKVNIEQIETWDEESQGVILNPSRGQGKLNTITYEGAYLVVTADNDVDLSEVVLSLSGRRIEIGEDNIAYLPADAEWVFIGPYCIQEKNEKKEVYFDFDDIIVNDDGTLTIPCTLKNNIGRLKLTLRNSDGTKVNIKRDDYSDTSARGRLNTSNYKGAYFEVTTEDNIDVTNLKFRINGKDVLIDNNGKAVLNEGNFVYIDKYSLKLVNPNMVPVTINATSRGAEIIRIQVNEVEFVNENTTNTVNATLDVEDCDEDRIIICVEDGKMIKSIRFNEEQEDLDGWYMSEFDFEYPHADTYTIEMTCEDDPNYMPNIYWYYEDEEIYERFAKERAIVKNGSVEIVSVVLPDGETIYDYEELYPEDKGYGRYPKHEEAYFVDEAEEGYGRWLYAQEGSIVTLKLIPDDGYEVSSLDLGKGLQLVPDPNVPNQYSFVMPRRTIFLSGLITKIEDNGELVQIGEAWCYVKDGMVDENYTGLVEYNNNWYYVQNGVLEWGERTLVEHNGTWYYVDNSTLDWNYTGLVEYNNNWYYVQNGVLVWGERTLVQYNETWYYVNNSTLDWNYTGLCEFGGTEYYIQKGVLIWKENGLTYIDGTWYSINNSAVQKGYTGLVEYNNSWYYVQEGVLRWGEETLVYHNGTWYYVNNSTLDWNYTGLCEFGGTEYYIQKGVLIWEENGLTYIDGTWYSINNSAVQKGYTGLVEYNNSWYYVQNGVLNWGEETLVFYNGTWYYVNNSTLDWNYTGLVEYNNVWYYVQNGVLNWGEETLVFHNGTWYYVNNSTLDWNYTGLCEYNGTTYYIQNGVLYWGYNGNIEFNGTNYVIMNSMVSI